MEVEQLGQPVAVAGLDRAVGEHERRRRLGPAREREDVPAKGGPGVEPVPPGEIPARLGDGTSFTVAIPSARPS